MISGRDSHAPKFDVTTLGETMLRLDVPVGNRLEDAGCFAVHPGGAESNVCGALAGLGRRCGWVSRLPDNPLGHLLLRRLRAHGIDTSAVVLAGGTRVGVYYVEFATPPRPIQVIYDRADSAAARMNPDDVDWDYLLDTRVLHLTGITPALSEECRRCLYEAIRRAKAAGVAVSLDVNYRSRLWSEQDAAALLRTVMIDVDLLICAREDAKRLFGYDGDTQDILTNLRSLTDAQHLVLTLGDAGVVALDGDRLLSQPSLPVHIVDRLGAGDALAAGILDGWLDGSLEEGLRRGIVLAALALSQVGDMLLTNRTEMNASLAGGKSGLVR